MDDTEATRDLYDQKYTSGQYYWGVRPSHTCFEVLRRLPPIKPLRLLDVGCGEGRNAIFFARNGYEVTAFDLSEAGIAKTRQFAMQVGVSIQAFSAELNTHRLTNHFDVIFSTGVLHCSDPVLRDEIFHNYKTHTYEGGLHVISVFVDKPFIARPPDADPNGALWKSGELFAQYADWQIEWCTEEIFDCMSSGVPHQHATDRIVARKPVQSR
jgi:tellurite methyltransferase